MNLVKLHLQALLCRAPLFYNALLQAKGGSGLEKRTFLQLVCPGDVVCDIGANRGYYTELFYHLAGAEGVVHAFEPVEPTYRCLTAALSFANPGRLVLNHQAVGDREGIVDIFLPNGDDGQASLGQHSDGSWQQSEGIVRYSAKISTLDSYTSKVALQRLDFVKIDIEGAELLALRGARDTLRRFRPWLCLEMCENWMKAFASTPEHLAEELTSCGYREAFLMQENLEPVDLSTRPLLPQTFAGSANLLCVGADIRRLARLQRVGLVPRRSGSQ